MPTFFRSTRLQKILCTFRANFFRTFSKKFLGVAPAKRLAVERSVIHRIASWYQPSNEYRYKRIRLPLQILKRIFITVRTNKIKNKKNELEKSSSNLFS